MSPIISTLAVNSFKSTGDVLVGPAWLDILMIAGGGGGGVTSNGGGGGIVSISNALGTSDNYNLLNASYDFGQSWAVTVGAAGIYNASGGNSFVNGWTAAGAAENPVKNMTALGGGHSAVSTAGYGGNGGSGGGGGGAGGSGGSPTGTAYGGLTKQGMPGSSGYGTWWGGTNAGAGGGFDAAGGAATDGISGTAGRGSQATDPSTSPYIWLGLSDNSSYSGEFSHGGGISTSRTLNLPGDAQQPGVVAIRFPNNTPNPTVTNATAYSDTTNNLKIYVWTTSGTFTWG